LAGIFSFFVIPLGFFPRAGRRSASSRCLEAHARSTRFQKPLRDRLLRRSASTLALPNLMHFLTHKLSLLAAPRFRLPCTLLCPLQGFFFRHDSSFALG